MKGKYKINTKKMYLVTSFHVADLTISGIWNVLSITVLQQIYLRYLKNLFAATKGDIWVLVVADKTKTRLENAISC
jgi:hypothetical protein